MKTTAKLSNEERRAAIIKAVRRVFAEKGFHGTTTRELALAAGVSEGLLFKHFPNKEALFAAMQLSCCDAQTMGQFAQLKALEPSASTLVLLMHFLVNWLLAGDEQREENRAIVYRLILRSLADDGEFARLLLGMLAEGWVPKVEECIRAAVAAGDALATPVRPDLAAWFSYNLAAFALLQLLPATPAVDYAARRDQLVEQAVWFALRGLGLKDAAIRRHYNPKALALFNR